MRRFTEILLLAAYIPLLSFATELQAAARPAVEHDILPKDGLIRGLLDKRQSRTCPGGDFLCAAQTFCCPVSWVCCGGTGICCEPGHYCVVATNGVIACCPNGRVCSGPAPPPTSIRPGPPPTPTTIFRTSTSTTHFTTDFTFFSTSTSTSTSTKTFTTLVGAPTEHVGDSTIEVSVLDVNMTWSENWTQRTSSCSPSVTSKSTTTIGSSFTYIFQVQSSAVRSGFFYYLNVVNDNTMWEVLMNGVSHKTFHQFSSSDCTYSQSLFIPPTGSSVSQNLTVVVHGSDSTLSNSWSLEVNKLLIVEPSTSSSTSTSLSPTNFSFSASERAQPYRPLLVFAGFLLALLYYA